MYESHISLIWYGENLVIRCIFTQERGSVLLQDCLFTQRRRRSTWPSIHSKQNLYLSSKESLLIWLPIKRKAMILISLRICAGWSESCLADTRSGRNYCAAEQNRLNYKITNIRLTMYIPVYPYFHIYIMREYTVSWEGREERSIYPEIICILPPKCLPFREKFARRTSRFFPLN